MMNKILFVLLCALLTSCTTKYQYNEGYIFGTQYHIVYQHENNLNNSIYNKLQEVNHALSSFEKNSVISKINRNEEVELDSLFIEVFTKAQEISRKTEGAFDITVAPLVNAWGFGYGKKNLTINIDSILQYVGYKKVRLENNKIKKQYLQTELITSAIAKGYGVDKAAEYLESFGIKNYMVEIGGEIRVKGKNSKNKSWIIGIDKPIDDVAAQNRQLQDKISMEEGALATSGNYRNFYYKDGKKYSHTINPTTGYPVKHTILSASVIADNCMSADAYATSFMVMGLKKAKELTVAENIETYIIYSDEQGNYKVWMSKGFKDYILCE